ncbi:transposase [Variovorax sp. WS11]|uniref:transposase n=1 Tax=Variovorax sp. WS11 TaxID=1105204 RepID=UPI0023B26043|nr:transposase [Variovorax sp. WS11]
MSIDMSPAFIKGVSEELPNAQITFDKFHVIWHANTAVDKTRRIEQRTDRSLKGMRWTLLKAAQLQPHARGRRRSLRIDHTAEPQTHGPSLAPRRAAARDPGAQAGQRDAPMLRYWSTCVMRSKVQPMKEVAALVRRHMDGIVAWSQTRQTNGFLEAINGLFQAAKRRARGFVRLSTIKTVIFLIAGKLDFQAINPHAGQPT